MKNVDTNTLLTYADPCVLHQIQKYARHYPDELKEEIRQDSALRIFLASDKVDTSKGWKSFVQFHARGAVLDYLKAGKGFIEHGKVAYPDEDGLKIRLEIQGENEGDIIDVSDALGTMGVHTDSVEEKSNLTPNWSLLNRMATRDFDLAIVGKILLGFSQEEIAFQYNLKSENTNTRERISQRMYSLFRRLDDPFYFYCRWERQCIFALGLSEKYGMPNYDNGLGWDLSEIDLKDAMFFFRARKQRGYA